MEKGYITTFPHNERFVMPKPNQQNNHQNKQQKLVNRIEKLEAELQASKRDRNEEEGGEISANAVKKRRLSRDDDGGIRIVKTEDEDSN